MRGAALVVVMSVACSTQAPPTRPAAPPTAVEIIARTTQAYATATTYRDRGLAGGDRFTTVFERARGMRFQYGTDDVVLWTAGETVFSVVRGIKAYEHDDLVKTLERYTNMTMGTSLIVPALLHRVPLLDRIETLALGASTTISGRRCHVITGALYTVPIELAVDADTFVLRRIVFPGNAAGRIDYEPQLGARVVAAELSGPDISNMEVARDAAPTWIGVLFEEGNGRVREVLGGSPAERAGVKRGDVVLELAGTKVATASDVIKTVQAHRAGSKLPLVLERAGARVTVSVVIEKRPDMEAVQRTRLVGKQAPDFTLATLDGGRVKLGDLRGKVVVLDFWASWCGPCVSAFPSVVKWHNELGPKGLAIVGVTDDELDAVKAAVAQHGLVYPIALDPEREAWRDYLVQALPTTIVIDKAGIVRYVTLGAGEEAAIEASIRELLR